MRHLLSRVLFGAAFILMVIGAPVLYVSNVLTQEEAFIAVADDIVGHPAIRAEVASQASAAMFDALEADELVAQALPEQARSFSVPLTRIASTQLTKAAFRLLDTNEGVKARQSALRELHRQFTADDDSLVLDLRAVLVRTTRDLGGPAVGAGVAKLVATSEQGRFTIVEPDTTESSLLAVVRAIPAVGLLIWVASILAWLAAIAVAVDRRRALVVGGLTISAASLTAIGLIAVVLYGALGALSSGSAAGIAVAEIFTQDIAQQQFGTLLTGALIAITGVMFGDRPAAMALRRLPADLWLRSPRLGTTLSTLVGDNPPLARLVVWAAGFSVLTAWRQPTMRVVMTVLVMTLTGQLAIWLLTSATDRAEQLRNRVGIEESVVDTTSPAALRFRANIVVGAVVVLVFWPAWSQDLVVALFVTVAVVLALVEIRSARRLARINDQPTTEIVDPGGWVTRRRLLVATAVCGVVALGAVSTTATANTRDPVATECNGSALLCDRPINEVVFAGSHNAMSSTELGWDLAMQTGDMVSQLDHGVRALLIDALYWNANGRFDGGDNPAASAVLDAALSDDAPKPGTWLCHGFCALGATDLTTGLASIHIWLEENPREVLLIIVQDEITTEDLLAAFAESGLEQFAYEHNPDDPWPTLGDMINSDKRILVYGENGGSADSWFQNGWETAITETPYTFGLRSDFSCEPNRGNDANGLFLINHWLTTGIPVREVAESVNSRTALLGRVDECRAERGRLPTILATDFVETGDLVDVVAELNGVSEP